MNRHTGETWSGKDNPYGKPGRGNYDKVWEAVMCNKHKRHTLKVENGEATVIHHR